jgi:hypothetical protein
MKHNSKPCPFFLKPDRDSLCPKTSGTEKLGWIANVAGYEIVHGSTLIGKSQTD